MKKLWRAHICTCLYVHYFVHLYVQHVYMIFIHLSSHGHLGCSHILSIMNNAAMGHVHSCTCKDTLRDNGFISLDIHPEVRLLDHHFVFKVELISLSTVIQCFLNVHHAMSPIPTSTSIYKQSVTFFQNVLGYAPLTYF